MHINTEFQPNSSLTKLPDNLNYIISTSQKYCPTCRMPRILTKPSLSVTSQNLNDLPLGEKPCVGSLANLSRRIHFQPGKYCFKSKPLQWTFICQFFMRITYSNPDPVQGDMKVIPDADSIEKLIKKISVD